MLPNAPESILRLAANLLICKGLSGGPDRDRTDDLFHAMEARSQLRHRPTLPIVVQVAGCVNAYSCPIQDEPEGWV